MKKNTAKATLRPKEEKEVDQKLIHAIRLLYEKLRVNYPDVENQSVIIKSYEVTIK